MSYLLGLSKILGIDPGPLNQADLQDRVCDAAGKLLFDQMNIISEKQHRISELMQERDDALALVIRYQRLLECAIRSEEFVIGDAIVIGIDADLADEIEESFDESPKPALAALKAQWQAEALELIADEAAQNDPYTGENCDIWTTVTVRYLRLTAANLRQRAQEAGDVY